MLYIITYIDAIYEWLTDCTASIALISLVSQSSKKKWEGKTKHGGGSVTTKKINKIQQLLVSEGSFFYSTTSHSITN